MPEQSDEMREAALGSGAMSDCALDHLACAAQIQRVMAGPARMNRGDVGILGTVATMLRATSHESPTSSKPNRLAAADQLARAAREVLDNLSDGDFISESRLTELRAALREYEATTEGTDG
jgi:hypothetical protein